MAFCRIKNLKGGLSKKKDQPYEFQRGAGVKIPPLITFTKAVEMVTELPAHP